jgi:hypothetical protein
MEEIWAVGDEVVNAGADRGAHLFGLIGGPGNDADAHGVELVDGDAWGGVGEDGVVIGREDRDGGVVLAGVGGTLGHEREPGVVGCCGGRGLLGEEGAGEEGKRKSGGKARGHKPSSSLVGVTWV